jgi:hypothetical protein
VRRSEFFWRKALAMKKTSRASSAKHDDGAAGVRAWIAAVKAEHRPVAKRVDTLIAEQVPGMRRAIKWRKPSQPLGVPFYGLPDRGWIVALWSFKDRVTVGFFAGSLLDQQAGLTKLAGPWNKGAVKARRLDIPTGSELDEALLRSLLSQARQLPGWGKGSAELE